MRLSLLCFLALLLLSVNSASAQPSLSGPGGPGSHAPQHAFAPLPYTLSPMPSLPPPQSIIGEEPQPVTAGSTVQRPGYDARILDDGRLVFNDRFLRTGLTNDPTTGPRWGASFDIGDILTKVFADGPGMDPYLSDKLQLLHDTFAERVSLRRDHNEQTMDRALAALPRYLSAVWEEPSWDLPTKRRVLFALWDECAEDGNPEIVAGGAEARGSIIAFIGTRLPEGSPEGYTDDELSGFNQMRSSRMAFAPPTGSY